MVILHSYVAVYQRVTPSFSMPFDAESHFCSTARQQWSRWQHESGRVAPPVKRKLASEIREKNTAGLRAWQLVITGYFNGNCTFYTWDFVCIVISGTWRGKRLHNYGKIHHAQWVIPRTKSQFSIAILT
jgi:hypothetical protein